MLQPRGAAGTRLRLVSEAGKEPSSAKARAAGSHPHSPPSLVGLLLCEGGGAALGVVREVVGWDGLTLSLRLSLDPAASPHQSDGIVHVPLGAPIAAVPAPFGPLPAAQGVGHSYG